MFLERWQVSQALIGGTRPTTLGAPVERFVLLWRHSNSVWEVAVLQRRAICCIVCFPRNGVGIMGVERQETLLAPAACAPPICSTDVGGVWVILLSGGWTVSFFRLQVSCRYYS